jgi:hypothetical protein
MRLGTPAEIRSRSTTRRPSARPYIGTRLANGVGSTRRPGLRNAREALAAARSDESAASPMLPTLWLPRLPWPQGLARRPPLCLSRGSTPGQRASGSPGSHPGDQSPPQTSRFAATPSGLPEYWGWNWGQRAGRLLVLSQESYYQRKSENLPICRDFRVSDGTRTRDRLDHNQGPGGPVGSDSALQSQISSPQSAQFRSNW